ncbi:MAG: PKD domain-containing protein [Myxococcales bacterium]|nr:PKD domain-containing protein [Myxococcales bacterium]
MEFDGGGSFADGPVDQGFAINRWDWSFEINGQPVGNASGRTVARNAQGGDRVRGVLTVTDASGRQDTTQVDLEIVNNNLAPEANAGGPYFTGPVGNSYAGVDLDARASRDPNAPCDSIARWEWDTDNDGLFGAADVNGAGNLAGSDYVGDVVRGYISPAWQVGLVQTVRVRACDQSGTCGAPAEATIDVLDQAPPVGEILTPRADLDACVPAGDLLVRAAIRDPDGDRVRVELMLDDDRVDQAFVQTQAGGAAVEHVFTVDTRRINEGLHELSLKLTDAAGVETFANAGGPIPFDRTPPEVSIGAELVADACYNADEVPEAEVVVVDVLDDAPEVATEEQRVGCRRIKTVTATDHCGNAVQAQREYRVAEPVQVEITGPEPNELVAEASLNWRVVGAPTCANQITARMSQDGIPDRVYAENTNLVEPGNYTLALTVPDCAGNERQVLRAFRINSPPRAVGITQANPNRDPQGQGAAYLVAEGAVLTLNGGDSQPPELDDAIAAWAWDLNGDGQADVQGRQVPFPTAEDGFFEGTLTVTDSFGATGQTPFSVLVEDVDPVADPGGPYIVRQGEALTFDGTGSRPGSAADPLSSYRWDFGDGSAPVEGAAVTAPVHTYDRDGLYDARLVVRDEDSAAQAVVQVVVRDVNPVIQQVTVPPDPYDGARLTFQVTARPGAPADPVVSYEWDFDGDGDFDSVLPDGTASWRYTEPGDYEAVLQVRDNDSVETRRIAITVRQGTFVDELNALEARAAALLADPNADPRVVAALAPAGQPTFADWAARGRWAEANGYRGNTVVALDELTFRVYRAVAAGADFGDLMWRTTRRFLRSVEAQGAQAALQVPDDRPSLIRGDRSLAEAQQQFEDPDYEGNTTNPELGFVARDLFAVLADAFFYYRDAVDPNQDYDGFPMPNNPDPVAKVAAAEGVNSDLVVALGGLAREWQDYLNAGAADGPGRAELQRALDLLEQLRPLVAKEIGLECEGEACLTDRESLDLQLMLMDLVGELFAAADQGVYVRNFQNLLTLGIKFRVEVAILRIEFVCGANTALPRAAREQQRILLDLVARGENATALLFYIAPERRCLVVREYNECIVVQLPADNAAVDYPPLCESEEGGADGGDGGDNGNGGDNGGDGNQFPGGDAPIPLREPFNDLGLLLEILTAFLTEPPIDVMNPVVRDGVFPGRQEADFDRTGDGEFDLDDVDRALLQFTHDPVDVDGDGLIGIVELDCRIPGVVGHLDPEFQRTFDGVHDGSMDCDGDQLTNGQEVQLGMNPLDARDAAMDRDGDGVSNLVEVQVGMNPLDPADGAADNDRDTVSNATELANGMDPNNAADYDADFDQDGLANGVEANAGLNARDPADADADPDGDGMSSREEIAQGRNPLVADCAADPAEINGRNDAPENATVLGADNRYVVDNQTICNNAAAADVDYFRFTIDENNARLVVRLLHNRAAGDLDLRLYNAANGGQIADSSTAFDTEIIDVPRGQLAQGDYLLRVRSRAEAQGDYQLEVTVVPPSDPCVDDAWEGPNGNNVLGSAVPLPGEARLGATWVCSAERRTGDWFRVDLTDTDKTVHIRYARDVDGQLRLAAMNGDLSAFTESLEVQTNAQCINLRATGQNTPVFLNVTASTVFSDGDDRVDYVLQVVDTDLDQDPRGACDTLSGGLFRFVQWPTLRP